MHKTITLILALVVLGQSYGIYGRAQADRIMFDCTIEVGPLCYAWEKNTIGKILGERATDVEGALKEARENIDKEFIQKLTRKKKKDKSFGDILKEASKEVGKGLENAAEAAAEAIDGD